MATELRTVEFTGTAAGPHLLITGGVHGDEFEPVAAIRRLIQLFSEKDQSSEPFCGKVTFVPCVNEEAFYLGQRCASDGLDLARTCPGKEHGTITEQSAYSLSQLIKTADFYIDLHTGGTEFSIHPLAGYMLHPDEDILAKQRIMAQAFNLNVVWGTSPELDGRSMSVARDAHVPAIYCEYRGAATCSQSGVDAYVAGCLNVMSALDMISKPPQAGRIEHVVEDARPASGHLQVCHPAPASGYFEAKVQLGGKINQGELLGTVFSLDGSQSNDILSEYSGIVLMLRTFPRVQAGVSVGVVLEVRNFLQNRTSQCRVSE